MPMPMSEHRIRTELNRVESNINIFDYPNKEAIIHRRRSAGLSKSHRSLAIWDYRFRSEWVFVGFRPGLKINK